jgi:hypothetical protein
MGKLSWHQWGRFLGLTASAYLVWAAFWGILYRKFFWDFVGGIVRSPGGLQPASNIAFFITIIVKAPVVQILSMLLALGHIALDYPVPFLKGTMIYRSLVIRVVLLLTQASLAILYYQGTNGAIYSLIAAFAYTRAIMLGEKMEEAKTNRGRGGKA